MKLGKINGKGYIYILKNSKNGMMYVGRSLDLRKRFKQHKKCAKFGSLLPIHCALWEDRKYFKTAYKIFDEELLDEKEQYYIKKYNTIYPNGYNLASGGIKNKNYTESALQKIKEINNQYIKILKENSIILIHPNKRKEYFESAFEAGVKYNLINYDEQTCLHYIKDFYEIYIGLYNRKGYSIQKVKNRQQYLGFKSEIN